MDYRELEGLFNPSSVAVVGVTEDRFNLPLTWLQESEKLGYKGTLYAVSRREKIGHYPTYQRVADIPGPVGLCIVGVAAGAVPSVLEECVYKGVPWVVIMTSGFAETGRPEGQEMERRIRELIKGARTRVIGPNCVGPYCPATGITFEREMSEKHGEIAFVAQSGALSILLGRLGKVKGLGFSKVISYGNESDVGSDLLFEYMAHDPDTKIVASYLEGVRDEPAFLEVLRNTAARKPVVILKGGATATGTRAVSYHTGAEAGVEAEWQAVFRELGVSQVANFDELVDTLIAFTRLKSLRGNRVALISPSGGMSVTNTDICVRCGFQAPELSPHIRDQLEQVLTAGTSARNPLDLAGFNYFDRKVVRQAIALLDADDRIDAILFHLPMDFLMPIVDGAPWFEEKFLNNLLDSRPASTPLVIILPHTLADGRRAEVERLFLDQGFSVFPSVERALRASAHVLERQRMAERVTPVT